MAMTSAAMPPIGSIRTEDVPRAAGVNGPGFDAVLTETRASRDAAIRERAQAARKAEIERRDAGIARDQAGRFDPEAGADPSLEFDHASAAGGLAAPTDPADSTAPRATPATPRPASSWSSSPTQRGASPTHHDASETPRPAERSAPGPATEIPSPGSAGASVAPIGSPTPQGVSAVSGSRSLTAVSTAASASTAASSTGSPRTAGLAEAPLPTERLRGNHARPTETSGYRSLSPHRIAMLEQARESVFEQIALSLRKNGTGEMRLWLQPRELGRIDVQVELAEGDATRLWIRTERPELGAMLEQHRDRLETELRAAGFDVQGSTIEYGDSSSGRFDDSNPFGAPRDPDQGSPQPQDSKDHRPTLRTDSTRPARGSGLVLGGGFDIWA